MTKKLDWFENIEWRTHPWPGLNWITSSLVVLNVENSIVFYSQCFNFVPIFELPDDTGEIVFARLRYRGNNFTLSKQGFDSNLPAPNVNNGHNLSSIIYIYCDDAKKAFDKTVELGAKVLQEPKTEFWGDLRARIKAPDGHIWDIAQKI